MRAGRKSLLGKGSLGRFLSEIRYGDSTTSRRADLPQAVNRRVFASHDPIELHAAHLGSCSKRRDCLAGLLQVGHEGVLFFVHAPLVTLDVT